MLIMDIGIQSNCLVDSGGSPEGPVVEKSGTVGRSVIRNPGKGVARRRGKMCVLCVCLCVWVCMYNFRKKDSCMQDSCMKDSCTKGQCF